jgi:fluoroquinolone transport system permease protein
MNMLSVVKTLTIGDFKNIRRDSLLNWMMLMPIISALFLRLFAPMMEPYVTDYLSANQFNILLISYFIVLLNPTMFGAVLGFVLLDEKDDNTLTAIQVTPVSLNGYLAYRVALPMALSIGFTLLCIPLAGILSVPLLPLVPITFLAAMEAPIVALYAATFAKNKVQGFALMKFLGVFLVTPLVAYVFVQSNWQLLVGVLPTYWPLKCFWIMMEGSADYWLYLAVGVLFHGVLLFIFLNRFSALMHKGAA